MNKLVKNILLILSLIVIFSSCEKNPGEGGNVTIVGSVWVKDYNSTFTLLHGEYAAMDEDVFIVYGDNIGYDDKTKTDYLGNYKFNYLRPGKYTIFVYSKDSAMQTVNGEIAIIEHVEITQSKAVFLVPQIIIFN
ncbi:MAG: hypothetical protein PHP52_13980 [Bacteroidales bacterium]|nr:hypothetical protein [Bacteroidales bacterium]MDD4150939.1 hypothetical protein [Bacteroidales bacterium]